MRIPTVVAPMPGTARLFVRAYAVPVAGVWRTAALALALGAAAPLAAQARRRPGTLPAVATRPESTYYGFQVDTLAEPDAATPPALRAQGVGGLVVVRFVVDTAGRVDMRTFRVLSSDDTAFTRAVRATVARAEFLPALLDGRKVRQYVEQPFTFKVDMVPRPGAGGAVTVPPPRPGAGAPR